MTAGRVNSHSNHHWCTPPKYVEAIKSFFGGTIDLDPCSNNHSIVGATEEYKLPDQDGLSLDWGHRRIFVNPPYGSDMYRKTTIKNWLFRCNQSYLDHASEVIALVPVATNTSHWKKYVWGAASAICFLYDTRLKFLVDGLDNGKGAPMSCALIYWGSMVSKFCYLFGSFGASVDINQLKFRHENTPENPFQVRTEVVEEAGELS